VQDNRFIEIESTYLGPSDSFSRDEEMDGWREGWGLVLYGKIFSDAETEGEVNWIAGVLWF
jgi:hypothetical protein